MDGTLQREEALLVLMTLHLMVLSVALLLFKLLT